MCSKHATTFTSAWLYGLGPGGGLHTFGLCGGWLEGIKRVLGVWRFGVGIQLEVEGGILSCDDGENIGACLSPESNHFCFYVHLNIRYIFVRFLYYSIRCWCCGGEEFTIAKQFSHIRDC